MPGMNLAYDNDHNNKYDLNKYRKLDSDNNYTADSEKELEYITIKKKNADRGNTFKIFFSAIAALVLLFCVVYGKVQISDMYNQINKQKAELTVMESENARLKAEIESYTSLKNIEEYAENIGLKKLDKAQIWYVDIQNDDVVKVPENEENWFLKVKKSILSFFDRFA